MNKIFYLITVMALMISSRSFGEKLPLEFHFSEDGYRLIRGGTNYQGFYDMETVDTIFLDFPQSNYWAMLTENYSGKIDIPAQLTYKGKSYDSVGVRFKGMTSYQKLKNSDKKSFNISMDYVHDQDIDGYTTFNLNNGYEDESRLREFLYMYYNRKHIPAAKANFIILMINGTSWGIYTNVQQLNKQHAREWFEDADATRWRAEGSTSVLDGRSGGGFPPVGGEPRPNNGGGNSMFGAGSSTLNYLGDDTATYQESYTLKNAYKENPWEDLILACKVLNTVDKNILVDSLNKVMDVDGALWFLAQEILFTDDDGYVNKGGMDYCVYYDLGTNRLIPIEYDGNTTFLTKEVTSWTPFYKEDNVDFPLMNVLFAVPELRQRYLAHVRTIIEESINSSDANIIVDKYAALIDNYVNEDPQKIYSYSEFKSSVTAIKNFISSRNSFLLNNAEVKVSAPIISNVVFKAGEEDYSLPDSDDTVVVNAKVEHKYGIKEMNLYYGANILGTFNKTPMFDDGMHNDGNSGDGTYGAVLPAFEKNTYVRFYIEAVDATASGSRSYAPQGAEHDVYIYKVKVADKVSSDVVINEIMASNPYYNDQDGESDDWIELYNNSSYSIDLSGYYITDNSSKLTKWEIPSGTYIEANGYLIIWADKDTLQNGLHSNFKLSSKGEELLLVTPEIFIADQVEYNEQNAKLSFARMENGIGSFTWQQPTFNSENIKISTTSKGTLSQREMILYPNPGNNLIHIELTDQVKLGKLYIYDIYGKVLHAQVFEGETSVDMSGYSNGIYIVSVDNNVFKRLVIAH